MEGKSLLVVDLGAVSLSESVDGLACIPIAMIGTFYKGKQKFTITRADVAMMAANFKKRGNGEVVIDYEHASVQPDVAAGGPIPAAGWIVGINPEPDANGVVWGEAKFNARARDMIAAGEYKYGSPSLDWGFRDKNTGDSQGLTLVSFALTNMPVLDAMPSIRLSELSYAERAKCPIHRAVPLLCPDCDAEEIKSLNASEGIQLNPAPALDGSAPATVGLWRELIAKSKSGYSRPHAPDPIGLAIFRARGIFNGANGALAFSDAVKLVLEEMRDDASLHVALHDRVEIAM